jgi:ribosomal protein S18 acetylase RimI-like enzyme
MTDAANVVVTYLELRAPAGRSAATRHATAAPFTLHRERPPGAAGVAAALYSRVGGPWHWTDRLPWTEADWQWAIHRNDTELWVARIDDAIVGYFELQLDGDAVELRYFGLVPEFMGRGLGRSLLSAAIERAWALGKDRLTVNTCTLDHPAALANYLKRGFTVLRTATRRQEVTT